MTSSVQTVVKEDGVTPADAFDMGAGSIRADRAVNPTLVFNETYANMVAAGSDTLHRIDLNIPIDRRDDDERVDHDARGRRSTSPARTRPWTCRSRQPAGVTITVGNDNHTMQIDKDGTLTFPITINAPSVANGQYQGRINLVSAQGRRTRSRSRSRS